MCGICGETRLDGLGADIATAESMSGRLVHRGPDDSGSWNSGPFAFAHKRLSIIDLESGRQPLSNEDGKILVTYNGEIYNHEELRKHLESRGHEFKSSCDTEVIVHLYEEYGESCPEHLNGMFAFAVADLRNRRLFLARDRIGQKPLLYFYLPGKVFAFASEMQALRMHPEFPNDIDMQSLYDYLTLQYVPAPDTIFKSVKKLRPGHVIALNLDRGAPETTPYWSCNYSAKTDMNYEDAAAELRRLLGDSVEKRLMSDVPLGFFLSGGLDSTVIAAVAAEKTGCKLNTFSIGFDEESYDERRFANIAAFHAGSDHREKTVSASELADFSLVEKLVQNYGEPYCDASMLPTYILSSFAREHVTVALSGDGADELFGGYYRYLLIKYADCADRKIPFAMHRTFCEGIAGILPSALHERSLTGKAARVCRAFAAAPEDRYLSIISRLDEDDKAFLKGAKFKNIPVYETSEKMNEILSEPSAPNSVEIAMEHDLHGYLPGDILTKIDIASMSASLELRSPFMDHRLVEFAASLPLEFKIRGFRRKRILLDAFRDIVPPQIARRRKMGFGVPLAHWFRNEWEQKARERLLGGQAVSGGFFRKFMLERMLNEHCRNQADFSYPLWAALVFEIWLDGYSKQ